MLFIGCSTTPVRFDKPVKVDDYKYFVKLKEETNNPVSKKPFSQKLKEVFTTEPEVRIRNDGEIKRVRPPKRRIRKTNTRAITNEATGLLANTRPRDVEEPQGTGNPIMLYLIYLQALIIAVFAYTILRRQKKVKKTPTKTGELNL